MTVYVTKEHAGHGKHNYYWREYRLEDSVVVQYKCHRQKIFDGDENYWDKDEDVVQSWQLDDPNMPEWLHQYV